MQRKIFIKKKGKPDFEDCTNDVQSMELKNGHWEIVFKTSDIAYPFSRDNVRLMNEEVAKKENEDFGHYEYDNEKSREENILQYLVQFCYSQAKVANREGNEDEDEEGITPFGLVGGALESMSFKDSGSALEAYLKGSANVMQDYKPRIFPFGCNGSQKKAVEEAITHQISIIEGPPGTGKTQTILNLVANLIIRGKTIAIVSNNNSAVENIVEKLTKYDFEWLCARLGRKDLREAFFEKPFARINTLEEWSVEKEDTLKENIEKHSEIVDKVFESQVKLQKKRADLSAARHEKDVFCNEHKNELNEIEEVRRLYLSRGSSVANLISFRDFVVDNFDRIKWYQFRKRYTFWKAGVKNANRFLEQKEYVLYALNLQIYDLSIEEMERDIEQAEEWIAKYKDSVEEYISDSKTYFKHVLRKSFKDVKKEIFTFENYKEKFDDFTKRFPIVLSSAFSLKSSSNKSFLYDYLIIDEASQTNIPAAALCFGMAKNVVVVGDSRQLKHIVETNTIQLAENMDKGYDAVEESMLTSCKKVLREFVSVTMLKEHYRCHPLIIEYCNRRFYNDEMVIMSHDEGVFPFLLVDVNDNRIGYNGTSAFNDRQALDSVDIINAIKKKGVIETEIGVVAPYRAHADRVVQMLGKNSLVESDTVHKFQGREKDVIIYNSVMGKLSPFNDDAHLINVAVSRAKTKFVVVAPLSLGQGDSNLASLINFIQYQDPDCKFTQKSKRASIFDVLYGVTTDIEELKKQRHKNESPAETIFRQLLTSILRKADSRLSWDFKQEYYLIDLMKVPRKDGVFIDEEWEYMIKGARLDFLVYDTMSQNALLAIEINGGHHYKAASRYKDELKKQILAKLGVPLVSFKTDSIEGCEEKELRKVLNEVYMSRNK